MVVVGGFGNGANGTVALSQGSALSEIGTTGLRRIGGFVQEEYHRDLRGYKAVRVYKEMSDNDPVVGAIVLVVDLLIRKVSWWVEPASQSNEDLAAAAFLEECRQDMSSTWADMISEVMTMIIYGYSFLETVYKLRFGDNSDPSKSSKYNDGRIGWRKMPIRSQDSLVEWVFDDNGGVQAMVQRAYPRYVNVTIPIDKALLFRTSVHKGNPEGRSLLRTAYRPWYMKKHIETLEAIGIERDLAGIPMAWVPSKILSPNATAEEKATLSAIKNLTVNVRRDSQEGIVYPLEYDTGGRKRYDFTLLGSGGARQIQTDAVINRYDKRIAGSILADIVLIGQESVGSFALAASKRNLLAVALGAILTSIDGVLNTWAVPRLFALNDFKLAKLPTLVHDEVESVPLDELGAYIQKVAQVGALVPDEGLENYIRKVAGLPLKPVEPVTPDSSSPPSPST